jgi:hypothetical protein
LEFRADQVYWKYKSEIKTFVKETPEQEILRLKLEGKTYRDIKELIHTSIRRIIRVLRIYRENQRCADSAKLGRPSKVTATLLHYILDTTLSEPSICNNDLSQRILDIYGGERIFFLLLFRHQIT